MLLRLLRSIFKMGRYKSKYGTLYEIVPDGDSGGFTLSVVRLETKMVKRKSVTTERKQTYLRSSREDCFNYMLQVDVFDKKDLNEISKSR